LIRRLTHFPNNTINEHFYYDNGSLIRYIKGINEMELSLYIDDGGLIGGTEIESDELKGLLDKANKKKVLWMNFIKRDR
jgi:hypothetical protein